MICNICGKVVKSTLHGSCVSCLYMQISLKPPNQSSWNSWNSRQLVFLQIRDWHSYPKEDYISIWDWMYNYESIKRVKAIGCFEEVILISPIIETFDSDTFSYLFDYALGHKDLFPGAAYLIFKELKRRYKHHERLTKYQSPKGIDPRRENR